MPAQTNISGILCGARWGVGGHESKSGGLYADFAIHGWLVKSHGLSALLTRPSKIARGGSELHGDLSAALGGLKRRPVARCPNCGRRFRVPTMAETETILRRMASLTRWAYAPKGKT